MVPVPKSQLGAVYEALARSMRDGAPPSQKAGAGTEDTVEVKGQGSWTKAMVAILEADLEYPATRALFDMAAERAPRPVSFTEAAGKAGVEVKQLRAELGALSKITKRLFGTKTWPVSVKYGDAGDASYSMDQRLAKWWSEAVALRP